MNNRPIKITIGYDHTKVVGEVTIDKQTKELLATGEYILAPAFINSGEGGNELVQLGLIHEDKLVKESDR